MKRFLKTLSACTALTLVWSLGLLVLGGGVAFNVKVFMLGFTAVWGWL